MRRLRITPRHREREDRPSPVYIGSYEDKLSRIPRMHIDPDDDEHTREDQARERAYRDADRWPPFFG